MCHWPSKCFNGDRESEEDVAVEGKCEHETTLFIPLRVCSVCSICSYLCDICLQPALICAPATDHDLDSCGGSSVLKMTQSYRRETG